jgi:hypothetical protein
LGGEPEDEGTIEEDRPPPPDACSVQPEISNENIGALDGLDDPLPMRLRNHSFPRFRVAEGGQRFWLEIYLDYENGIHHFQNALTNPSEKNDLRK